MGCGIVIVVGYLKSPTLDALFAISSKRHTTTFAKLIEITDTRESTIVSNLSEFSKPSKSVYVKQESTLNFIANRSMVNTKSIQREPEKITQRQEENSLNAWYVGVEII